MKRILPQTLFGQTLIVLLLGIGLSLLAGAWIYGSARQEAVRAVGALAAAERIINVSRLVADAPVEWRKRLVEGASDPMFRVDVVAAKPELSGDPAGSEVSLAVADYLKEGLPERSVDVAVEGAVGHRRFEDTRRIEENRRFGNGPPPASGRGGGWSHGSMGLGSMGRGPMARAQMSWRGLTAAVALGDGHWLRFATSLPETGATLSPRLWLALGVTTGMIVLLTGWAVRRMMAPLEILGHAALRLGRNVDAPPLETTGSVEMRGAAAAFNDMQSRLRRLIENRTQMLAAISHDLRTQLTLLRLRTEAGAASDDRERMLHTISEMEEMLTATLSFAREESQSEARKPVDLGALVSSVADDMSDAGLAVTIGVVAPSVVMDCKPLALRRALTNLIDNAVKYGGGATVSLTHLASDVQIAVEDNGPGIPEDQIARVLQPFYRLETSRSRETGGIGLGLAIAASIAEAHGGALSLSNRPEGGLRAQITLPL